MAPGAVAAVSRGPTKLKQTAKVRLWKGKPGAEVDIDDSDDDDEDEEEESVVKKRKRFQAEQAAERAARLDKDVVAGGAGRVLRQSAAGNLKVDLKNVEVGKAMPIPVKKEEEESEEEETDDEEEEEEVKPKTTIPRPPGSESSEYETDSEEESEEEKKPAFRPVFVRKDLRGMTQEKAQALAEEKIKQEEESQAQRKNDSKEIAGETIRRELAEKESTDIVPDIDDTDGLDPTTDFDLWRARELARLLRDKQAQAAKDEEQEEIERRRAMPEEQRLREDMEFAEATRNREKGEMGFMQKYYHKGAFHTDDNLLARDYTGATESAVDVSMLPKVMQVRDFGKASRTKYTHLADQDTSAGGWGNAARLPASMGIGASNPNAMGTTETGCWNCGGPHLRSACPNQNINDPLVLAGIPNLGGSSTLPGMGPFGAGMGMGMGGSMGGGMGQGGPAMDNRPQDSGYGQRRGAEVSRGGQAGSERREDRSSGAGRREYREDGRGEVRRRHDDDRRGGDQSDGRRERHRDEDRHRVSREEREGRYDRDDRKRPRSADERNGGRNGEERRRRDKAGDGDRDGDNRRRREERDRDRDRGGGRDGERDRDRR